MPYDSQQSRPVFRSPELEFEREMARIDAAFRKACPNPPGTYSGPLDGLADSIALVTSNKDRFGEDR
ncbi:hypothetical protein [Phenylobacterium soli]|uniref:Uncharacterized protein n=1 Tax=Phenylobacterium soli TaxID=2170551 RepID=A0A328ADY2_9CAUL|nr:hypothetical protein [Phenylobacterium soli]RAK51614.1 hypothetical protein DJ017_17415 [Phenylobacterium soli]